MDRDLRTVAWLGLVLVGFVAVLVVFSNDKLIISEDVSLEKFDSYDELKSFLEENTRKNTGGFGLFGGSEFARASGVDSVAASGAALNAESKSSAQDYSQTNVQVEGVDELDIVKNDGRYIYTAAQNKVVIADAYPADSLDIVSEIDFDNWISGIFVFENRLIVVEPKYGYSYGYAVRGDAVVGIAAAEPSVDSSAESKVASILPPQSNTAEVRVYVYDISDRSAPALLETFTADGNYYAARLVGKYLYLISNQYVNTQQLILPTFSAGNEKSAVAVTDIYYPIISEQNLFFTSVMAIDVDSLDYSGDVFLTGASGALYVSEGALYITHSKSYDWQKVQEESVLDIFLDVLPGDVRNDIKDIFDSGLEQYKKSEQINLIFTEYFNSLTAVERAELQKTMEEATQKFYADLSKKYERTVVHKVAIDKLDISYSGSGEVPGYVLNQFSMDEHDGYFRIATTTGNIGGSASSLNHLYVLDEDLDIVGSVEDLAPGERIYSTRFVGDTAYMVTFRQVDPLYVIDVSNPRSPKVLGYLKVPGFSNYLQPIGDDLLLGIGRGSSSSLQIQGREQGLKVSLFDVSDFENPRELDTYIVEGQWSYSEAEYEHKAVLFDDEKDLLVIPVTYYVNTGYNPADYWQGAFVFKVTDSDISLRGKVAHNEKTGEQQKDYGYGQSYVRRALFMDDTLYTLSDKKIQANDLLSLDKISSVNLPYNSQGYVVY